MTIYTGMTFEIRDDDFNEDKLTIRANNLDGHISITEETVPEEEDGKSSITISYSQLDQLLQVLQHLQKIHGTARHIERKSCKNI